MNNKVAGYIQRPSTLDWRYLTLLCDNLKLFSLTLLWECVMFFQLSTSFHYSTAKQFHYRLKNNTSRSKNDFKRFFDQSRRAP
jgi:hypothetical protein